MPRNSFLRFYFPETATGSPAAPAAAPITPPAVNTGTPSGDLDISKYEPPKINISDVLGEDEPPKPAAKPAAAPKPGAPPSAKAPETPEVGENEKDPVKLRQAYAKAKTDLSEREKALEALRTELETAKNGSAKEIQEKIDAQTSELKKRDERIAAMERELTLANPLAHREVRELEQKFDEDMSKVFRRIPKFRDNFTPLAQEFIAIDPNSGDYTTKLQEFRDKLDETFGRDADRVFDAVEQAAEFNSKRAQLREKVQREGKQIIAQEQAKNWQTAIETLRSEIDSAFQVPEDIAASDPYHPALMLQRMEKAAGDDTSKKVDATVRKMIETAMIGFKPKTDADYPGMSPEQITEARQREQIQLIENYKRFVPQAATGLKLYYYLRSFFKDYMALNEERERRATAAPPDPSKGGKGEETTGGKKEIDVANYIAPPPVSERDLMAG